MIESRISKLHHDSISEYGKDASFLIRSALDPSTYSKKIEDENIPIVQYGVQPGQTICLVGSIKFKRFLFFMKLKVIAHSDAPKVCFKNIYQKGADMSMDYFTCLDCKLNCI